MGNNVKSRYDYKFGTSSYIIKDVNALSKQYTLYMLDRLNQMFNVYGLPETIPKKDLLFIKHTAGHVTITKVNNNLYAFNGALGGVLNEYYLPTLSVVANPFLNFSKSLKIDSDCVVILNDSMYMGLGSILEKYSYLLAQNDISMYWCIINTRMPKLFGAGDDNTAESVKSFYDHLEKGDKMEAIGENSFINTLKEHDLTKSSNNDIIQLIEMRRYLLANFFKELGIPANDNGKREAINSAELSFDSGVQTPLIDNIMEEFKSGLDKVNKMYGTNIRVELASSWEMVRKEIELDLEEQDEKIISKDIVNGEEISSNEGVDSDETK